MAVVLLLGLTLAGCRPESEVDGRTDPEGSLVLAASSLRAVMPDLLAEYEPRSSSRVRVVYGSSSALASQIESGAPVDLFLAADEVSVDRLVDLGHVDPRGRHPYAAGRLALVWRDGVRPLSGVADLGDDEYQTIAIANPGTAPYGAAAVAALATAGVLEPVRSRLVHAESVSDAYHFVLTGNADAGIVAASLVLPVSPLKKAVLVDRDLHPPLIHVAAIPSDRDSPAARALLDFILSEPGQAILSARGLDPITH